jgi:hypothetical protein
LVRSRGEWWPVAQVSELRARKVGSLETVSGYSLPCTPNTEVFTPEGWQEASQAKIVLVRHEEADVKGYEYFIGDRILSEATSGTDLVLVCSPDWVRDVQSLLLDLAVFSTIVGRRLVIKQPWAWRYHERVGIKNPHVAEFVRLGQDIGDTPLPEAMCRHVAALVAMQNFDKMTSDLRNVNLSEVSTSFVAPEYLHEAQVLQAAALHGALTRAGAKRGREALRLIPFKDVFVRSTLVNLLDDISRDTVSWEDVKRFKRAAARCTVLDVTLRGTDRLVASGILTRCNRSDE